MSKKQHISVGVRVRPLLHEQLRKSQQCVVVENNRVSISLVHKLKHFDFPMVFDKSSSQQSVFQNCLLPLVQNLFQGFNCAFLSCGQNKSGKTYTIDGGDSQQSKGMISRLVDFLSLKLGSQEKQPTYMMRMSYVEIYDEEIIDLLGIRKRVSPQIVQKGRQIEFKGVELKHIHKVNEIENYWIIGNRKRQLAYSKKYRNPQKSTSIFTIYLQSLSQNQGVQQVRKGKLHIVDMAATKINNKIVFPSPLAQVPDYNLSLNALKNVSNALVYSRANNNLIPYRDSKVTLLLRENLGGLGRTYVLFHLIPTSDHYSSSIQSLRLARVLMQVQNQVYCDIHSTKSTIVTRRQQLSESKRKIQQLQREINACRQKQLKGMQKQGEENQFLSESLIHERRDLRNSIESLLTQKMKLKKIIQNIQSLFLKQVFSKQKSLEYRSKYKNALFKKHKDTPHLVQSLGSSREFGNQSYQANGFKDKTRSYVQEIFDLQTQFQEERQLLLQKIRKLQGQFKFYERVSLQTVKKQEIDILRGSSRYDSTKRSYEVPNFAVRQKKLGFAEKMFQSHRNTLSERKFMMIKSLSERQGSLTKRRQKLCEELTQRKKESEMKLKAKIKEVDKRKGDLKRRQKLNTQYFPNHTQGDQEVVKQENKTNMSNFQRRRKVNQVSKSFTRLKFK